MSRCALCGFEMSAGLELCPHHHATHDDERWAASNRVMCDLLHRGKAPVRVPASEREEALAPGA